MHTHLWPYSIQKMNLNSSRFMELCRSLSVVSVGQMLGRWAVGLFDGRIPLPSKQAGREAAGHVSAPLTRSLELG